MEEFIKHFNNDGLFNVLVCSSLRCQTSLPSPYLLKDEFSQERLLKFVDNFDENFFKKLEKLLPKDKWNIVISQEAFLNKIEKVPGFASLRKDFLKDEIVKFIIDKSRQYLKTFLTLSMFKEKL